MNETQISRFYRAVPVRLLAAVAAALVLAGCATGPERNPRDPFEPFNRSVYKFNDTVDRAVLKPVATVYRDVTPSPVRTGVGNFFRNLTEPWSLVNNLLQGRIQDAGETWIRFAVNTVFGIGGLIDIAGEANIDRHKQDFGQTLAFYGVPTGPYLILPLLGPSTVRDTAALPVDLQGNLLSQVDDVAVRNSLYALRVVDTRASLLRVSSVLDGAALDQYSFTRDAFLQLRRNQRKDTTENDGDLDDAAEAGVESGPGAAAAIGK
ncbi:VacJ family lipoprotein [Xylophilus rhododendri]|uniref:VacJ family lipoprotein n=1 Tax=Xylophilus rhododendri TaxID=2697032 RepID=A0A857J2P8_9BURK|nr:VacJ family lipoprotein [Xylophilus rhododendri]QHI98204.1 VacJ family lipoprotein [Xylophilus rhododendri]